MRSWTLLFLRLARRWPSRTGGIIVETKIVDIAKNNVLNQYIIENANLRVQVETYRLEVQRLQQELADKREEDDVD